LLEGQPLPGRDEIEAAVAPMLCPIDDWRGSAGFKRLRASALVAEALIHAEARQ
jgi:CO/xanthine dehydrogenase FAD-binding subunit